MVVPLVTGLGSRPETYRDGYSPHGEGGPLARPPAAVVATGIPHWPCVMQHGYTVLHGGMVPPFRFDRWWRCTRCSRNCGNRFECLLLLRGEKEWGGCGCCDGGVARWESDSWDYILGLVCTMIELCLVR